MKCCSKCKIEKDDSEFRKQRTVCKSCLVEQTKIWCKNNPDKKKEQKKRYREKNPDKVKEERKRYRKKNFDKIKEYNNLYCKKNYCKKMISDAYDRAKLKNLPFDIEEKDIFIPDVCPILGIPIESGIGKGAVQPNSPSLDRIIPEKGYVKGNIMIISNKANTMKNNATPEEMIKLGEYGKKLLEEAKGNI